MSAASPTSVIKNHAVVAATPDFGVLCSADLLLSSKTADVSDISGFWNELGEAPDRLYTESPLSSPTSSFHSYASEIEEGDESFATPTRREPIVVFQGFVQSSYSTSLAVGVTLGAIKKGACYSCLRGGRFMEKESYLACNAKYCSRCMLMAMGSMPEERKCISCIEFSILESSRERSGKSSRLLKRLLSNLEVCVLAQKVCALHAGPLFTFVV